MKQLHVLLEGPTERVLFDRVFAPYWEERGWLTTCSVVITSRAGGTVARGGVSSWAKLKREIHLLLKSQFDAVTTIIDYYGFPADAPGMADRPDGTAVARVEHVEGALEKVVGDPRFIPHLTLHEVEAWVFAAADQLAGLAGMPHLAAKLSSRNGISPFFEGVSTFLTCGDAIHRGFVDLLRLLKERCIPCWWARTGQRWAEQCAVQANPGILACLHEDGRRSPGGDRPRAGGVARAVSAPGRLAAAA